MNVCVISWTKESASYIKRFAEEINVNTVIEKDVSLWGKQPPKASFQIVSFDAAIIRFSENRFEKFIIPYIPKASVLHSMYVVLKQYNISDESILYIPFQIAIKDVPISVCDLCLFYDRPELDRLELHINDHCNLRCVGCSMLAGLVKEEANADYDITIQSLVRLKTVFPYIHEIDLFGGEPLLNPDILRYCETIRNLYPEAVIFIVTNGVELLSKDSHFFNCLKENYIRLSITYYPIFDTSLENALHIIEQNQIEYNVLERRTHFLNLYDFSGQQNPGKVFDACKRKLSIIALRENKLASCYTPFAFCYAEKAFKIGYKEDGIIDVLGEELSPRKIIQQFMQPLDCCRFCHCDQEYWHQAHKEYSVEDWSR